MPSRPVGLTGTLLRILSPYSAILAMLTKPHPVSYPGQLLFGPPAAFWTHLEKCIVRASTSASHFARSWLVLQLGLRWLALGPSLTRLYACVRQVTLTRASDGETMRRYPMHSQILELHFRSKLTAGPREGKPPTTDWLSINLGQSLLVMQVRYQPFQGISKRCSFLPCRTASQVTQVRQCIGDKILGAPT